MDAEPGTRFKGDWASVTNKLKLNIHEHNRNFCLRRIKVSYKFTRSLI